MSEYKSQCGCKIHVAQWTSKRKLVSVKQCPLHKAAPALLEACKAALEFFSEGHALDRFDWGKSFLRAEDIRELNELPIKLTRAIAAAEREEASDAKE